MRRSLRSDGQLRGTSEGTCLPEVRQYGRQAGDLALLRSPTQILLGGGNLGGRAAFQGRRGGQQGGRVDPGCGGKANDERAAPADVAPFERERTAVAVGQLAADEEAEPGAGLRSESRIVDSAEAVEDLVGLVTRDADPGVLDDQGRPLVVDNGQPDPRPPGTIGQRVVDEVIDD